MGWSAIVAVPLGLLMGSFPWLYHFVAPIAAPMRSMPITAFLPAFIALFGLDEAMKIIVSKGMPSVPAPAAEKKK